MCSVFIITLTLEDLQSLVIAMGLWDKIVKGCFKTKIPYKAPSHNYPDSTSQIVKHFDSNGKHIATTHRIVNKQGKTLHWDICDIHIESICINR